MPDTLPTPPRSGARLAGRWAALLGAALVALAAACTEQLETTAVCPDLCPEQEIEVEELVLQPVVLDSTLPGFPLLGNEPYLALVRRGDTLETRAAIRFDVLPRYYRLTSAGTDSAQITTVVDPVIQLVLDRRFSAFTQPVTIEAFDITHAGPDTSTAAVLPLFTPARRLGQVTAVPPVEGDTVSLDTLQIPLEPATLLARITGEERLRVGLRVTGADQVSLLLTHGATIRFRAVADTAVPMISVVTRSQTPVNDPGLQADFRSYVIVAAGTPPPDPTAISVGGLPGRRSFLRFQLPSSILDSTTIVRATLVLTQRPISGFTEDDSLSVRVLPVITTEVVTDIDRLTRLAANPRNQFGSEIQVVPTLRLVPGDSGHVELPVANVVALWSQRSGGALQPSLVLAAALEGATPLGVSFFSSEAAADLRPFLRLSFIRRVNFDLP
jgi:hypothetical protein